MDRTRATSTLNSALIFSAIAVAVFGLAFVISIIYIG